VSTFGSHPIAVAATLLDLSTGAMLAPVAFPVGSSSVGRVMATERGRREARKVGDKSPRRLSLPVNDMTSAEFALVADALDAAGGAGAIELRHPDDDPADPPTLWRRVADRIDYTRDAAHRAGATIELEEI